MTVSHWTSARAVHLKERDGYFLVIDYYAHNREVALKRWKTVFDKELVQIKARSAKYPDLKARIVGYLMGDGSVTVRKEKEGTIHHSISFFPDDYSMLKSFMHAFKMIYGRTPKIKKFERYYSARVDSKPIVSDLLELGSFHSLEWRVPLVLLSSRRGKIEWLRALFDCEAYVGPRVITVQSVNERGLQQVQSLIGEFGIKSRMYSYVRKQIAWNKNFLLCIGRKEDRIRFLKNIGFSHSRKQRKLQSFAGVA